MNIDEVSEFSANDDMGQLSGIHRWKSQRKFGSEYFVRVIYGDMLYKIVASENCTMLYIAEFLSDQYGCHFHCDMDDLIFSTYRDKNQILRQDSDINSIIIESNSCESDILSYNT